MKTYLVVGASSGIGQALRMQLKEEGHTVYSMSRRAIEDNAKHFTLDVLTDVLPEIAEPLDGIVYCPGSISLRSFPTLKMGDFKTDWDINVGGAIKVLQAYFRNLQLGNEASVVLFSTVAVKAGMTFHSSIAAAKGALEGLVRSLAAEWAPNIRVNAIAPSLTNTPLASRLLNTEAKMAAAGTRHPLRRVGDKEQVAGMAAFLLSARASFITGEVIRMDGGLSSLR